MEFSEFIVEFIVITILGGLLVNLLTNLLGKFFSKPKEKASDEISLRRPPHFDDKLIGRKSDIKKLRKKLTKNRCVWISSIGGIGKSTLAIIYAQKYRLRYKRIYWLSWKGTIYKTIEDKVNVQLLSELSREELYSKIIYFFREKVNDSTLLIIDGLDEYNSEEIEIIKSFRCKILITSRISSLNHIEHKLNMLSISECSKLFRYHAKSKITSEQLEVILQLTGRHTLSIKLLARYARCYSVDNLFKYILNCDIGSLHNSIEILDGEPNSQIIAYFTKIYTITYDQRKKSILMNLSFLPSSDLSIKELEELMGDAILEDIVELEKIGWIICRGHGTVYLHPVLSNTIRQISINENVQPIEYQRMIENVNALIAISFDEFDNYNYKERFLPYCESIVKYYRWEDILIAQLMMNISYIYYIMNGEGTVSLEYASKACFIFEKIYNENHNDEEIAILYARALSDLSEYYYKDSCSKAIEIEERSLKIKENILGNQYRILDLLKSYNNLMLYYYTNFDNSFFIAAKRIMLEYKDDIKRYKRIASNLYNHFALLLRSQNRRIESIVYLKLALEIIVANKAQYHYMYPMIISSLGGIYGELLVSGEFFSELEKKEVKKNALKYLYKGYHLKRKKYTKYTSSIAISLHNIATTWSLTGHNMIALLYEYKALRIRKDIPEERLYMASSLLRLGIIFSIMYSQYSLNYFKLKGREYLEEAQKMYAEHVEKNTDANCNAELASCKTYLDSLRKTRSDKKI
ncbi:MAG: NB-ARC domain-containing protein [Ruminococcus flavefaciens]|nr:NB-ARC domain-containing protein [Ruminococcus flavefaciens]